MSRLPIAHDVAALVGPLGEAVQNRSLLLDKFTFHKNWGGDGPKNDDAHRFSLLRISDGGSQELNAVADDSLYRAGGRNVTPEKADALERQAQLARQLANTKVESTDAQELRRRHSRRFLALAQASGRPNALVVGRLEGRLAINLATGLLQNAGISLDRLFGLPVIPGSSIKGVCRAVALAQLQAEPTAERLRQFQNVFGTATNDFERDGELAAFTDLLAEGQPLDRRGVIAFFPASPVSESKLVVDLTNVHTPDYYRGGGAAGLATERPQPNPFPAVEAGALFGFVLLQTDLTGDASLLAAARAWLVEALTVRGLGAKTAAGYGWFSIDEAALARLLEEDRRETEAAARRQAEARAAEAKAQAAREAEAALSPEERESARFRQMPPDPFAAAVAGVANEPPETQKAIVLALLSPAKRETWKTWKRSDKPANKARVEAARAAAARLGLALP